MSVRRLPAGAIRAVAVAILVWTLVLSVSGLAAAEPAPESRIDAQATATADSTATETVAGTTTASDRGDSGGGPLGLVTGALGAVFGFLTTNPIGHALVGVPLGIYLGLKIIAYYLEYAE